MEIKIKNVDFNKLRTQKEILINMMQDWSKANELEGLLNLIDEIQDYAVDVLGVDESEVFNLKSNEDLFLSPQRDKEPTKSEAESSWGMFRITKDGYIQWGKSEYETEYLNHKDFYIRDIKRFDLEEVIVYLNRIGFPEEERESFDIADLGYWDHQNVYHKPDYSWREEIFHGGFNVKSSLNDKETLIDRILKLQYKWIKENRE